MTSCPSWALAPLLLIASTVGAALGRMGFDWAVGPSHAFLLPFLVPVIVTAMFLGTRWGLFATALNTAIVVFFFTPPEFTVVIRDFDDQVRIGTFVVIGAMLSLLAGRLHIYRLEALEYTHAMSLRQAELEREITQQREAEGLLEQRVRERTAEVEAQTRLLDAVLDALPVALIIADPAGRFIRVNRATHDLCGAVPPAEGVNDYQAWVGYWPGTDRRVGPMEWPLSRAVLGGESCTDEIVIERFGDQTRRTLQIHAAPVRGPDGTIMAGVVVGVDVTDQRAMAADLRVNEQKFRAVFHSQFQFIGLMSIDGVLLEANRAALAAAGVSEAEVLGKPFWETAWWTHDPAQQDRLREAIRRAAAGESDRFEASHPRVDGTLMWVDFSLTPYLHEGQVTLLIPEGRDITNRKLSEAVVLASEQRFQAFMTHAPISAWIVDAESRGVYTSPGFDRQLALPPGAYLGRTPADLWPVDFAAAYVENNRRVLVGGVAVETEEPFVRSDGSQGLSHVVKFPMSGPNGEPLVGGVAIDITAHRLAEAAVLASEVKFRTAFDHAPIGVSLTATDGRWLQVNRSLCEITGYTESELLASDFQAITHPDDIDKDLTHLKDFLAGTVQFYQVEKRYFHKRGHLIHVHLSVSMVQDDGGNPLYFICHIMDITQQKEAEKAIAGNVNLLRQFIKHSPAAIAMFDREVKYVQASDRWLTDYHLGKRDIIGQSHYDVFPDIPEHWRAIHQRVLGGAIEACQEDPFHRADGTTEWLQWECRPWHDASGDIGGLVMFTQLITERKRVESALRLSEERFRRLVEGVADHAIFMLDTNGNILSWNPAASKIKGYKAEEIIGQHFSVFYTPQAVGAGHPEHELAVAVAEGRYHEEGERVRKDGTRFWAAVTISALHDDTGRHVGFVKFTHDITQRKRSEEQIRASLREKEVLLKEIHHRVKNNLQIISALLHIQSAGLADPAVRDIFDECRGRVKSIALIHERLYRSGDLAGVDLAEYVRQLAADLYRGYKVSHENVQLDLDVSVPPLPIDIAIPCGLLLNELISNCLKHAFQDRAAGRIRITFRRNADGNVVLCVADDGVGFPAGLDLRTTPSFGLQLIHMLAEQLNGTAALTTESGATVAITFPAPREASP